MSYRNFVSPIRTERSFTLTEHSMTVMRTHSSVKDFFHFCAADPERIRALRRMTKGRVLHLTDPTLLRHAECLAFIGNAPVAELMAALAKTPSAALYQPTAAAATPAPDARAIHRAEQSASRFELSNYFTGIQLAA